MADVRPQPIGQFDSPEANQGVAVDQEYFYAIGNRVIAQYRKLDGELVKHLEDGRLIHLNGAVAVAGNLYAAHSNWPHRPVNNSVEIWNAETLDRLQSRSLGRPGLGYLTWLDFYRGAWWGAFAHYSVNKTDGKADENIPERTTLARFDRDWKIAQSWTFPDALLQAFGAMSNSGGSWGADGFLYLTGHDRPAVYRVKVPKTGTVLEWVNTLHLPIRGQGIAWDRQQGNVLYGIIRATDAEKQRGVVNKVAAFRYEPPANSE